jgi:hypothetical protein
MGDSPLHVLLARRTGEHTAPSELESALETDRIERLAVGPLSLGALHTIPGTPRSDVLAPVALSSVRDFGGNPFSALELARVLGGDVDPTQPLLVPETLEGLVRARLDDLPPQTRDGLLLVIGPRPSHRRASRRQDVHRPTGPRGDHPAYE